MAKNLENVESAKVVNQESAKATIESGKELSDREKVKALMTLTAVSIYCRATGTSEDEVNAILSKVEKSKFNYWIFTTPTLGENSKGEKITQEKWEAANPDAIKCDIFDKVQWYKKPVFLDDATTIVRIVSSYERYIDAKEKGTERYIKQLKQDMAESFIAGDIDKATEIREKIQSLLGE